jgi:hypothetical protein
MSIKLGQLRRWRDGTFKGGVFIVISGGPGAFLIEEYGVIRGVSAAAIRTTELLSDVDG